MCVSALHRGRGAMFAFLLRSGPSLVCYAYGQPFQPATSHQRQASTPWGRGSKRERRDPIGWEKAKETETAGKPQCTLPYLTWPTPPFLPKKLSLSCLKGELSDAAEANSKREKKEQQIQSKIKGNKIKARGSQRVAGELGSINWHFICGNNSQVRIVSQVIPLPALMRVGLRRKCEKDRETVREVDTHCDEEKWGAKISSWPLKPTGSMVGMHNAQHVAGGICT